MITGWLVSGSMEIKDSALRLQKSIKCKWTNQDQKRRRISRSASEENIIFLRFSQKVRHDSFFRKWIDEANVNVTRLFFIESQKGEAVSRRGKSYASRGKQKGKFKWKNVRNSGSDKSFHSVKSRKSYIHHCFSLVEYYLHWDYDFWSQNFFKNKLRRFLK